MPVPKLSAVLFDVFGTVVDWRTGIIRELGAFGARFGVRAPWDVVADAWRGEYQPSMEEVRAGRRPWVPLDRLHRESIERVLGAHGVPVPSAEALDELTLAWHRLDPWPDVVPGLHMLRSRYRIGTLSNGNTALLSALATRGRLPWDMILGAETAQVYKPRPEAYLRTVSALGSRPEEVMLVAAHNNDLAAAQEVGLRSAFVARTSEHGPRQSTDLVPTGSWDVVARDLVDLAERLGCSGAVAPSG